MTAGHVLHVHSEETGQGIHKFGHTALKNNRHWEEGRSTAPLHVEAAEDGRTVFLGGADGALISIDLRCILPTTAWDLLAIVQNFHSLPFIVWLLHYSLKLLTAVSAFLCSQPTVHKYKTRLLTS